MVLTSQQIHDFTEVGFLTLSGCFRNEEIEIIIDELPRIFADNTPARIMEKDGRTVRTVFGSHMTNEILDQISRHPRIVGPVKQILGTEVYIHQFKTNVKAAFAGDVWQWHQDYIYWLREDGMPAPHVTNAAILLDDVTEFNGPLYLVPGSHKLGVIETPEKETALGWMATVIADLKYSLTPATLAAVLSTNGIVAPKGRRGDVLLFHSNLVHGSPPNMSACDRRIIFVTYNSVVNCLLSLPNPRPGFLASRNFQPIVPVADNVLMVRWNKLHNRDSPRGSSSGVI